jgi:hypothetical protein
VGPPLTRRTLATIVATLLLAAPARAADVVIHGKGPKVDGRKLEDVIDLELGSADDVEHIDVALAIGSAEIEVVLRAKPPARGTVDLRDANDVERTIALFVGELVRGAPPEPPPPAPPPPAVAPTSEAPPPERAQPSTTNLYARALVGPRWMTTGGAGSIGARIEGGLALRALDIGVFGRFAHASVDDVLGSVGANTFGGGAAATYDFLRTPSTALGTGPRVAIKSTTAYGDGAAAVTGSSTSAVSVEASWELLLHVRVAAPVDALVALEAGYAFGGLDLRADDRRVLYLAGPFAGGAIGVDLH